MKLTPRPTSPYAFLACTQTNLALVMEVFASDLTSNQPAFLPQQLMNTLHKLSLTLPTPNTFYSPFVTLYYSTLAVNTPNSEVERTR